MKLEFENRVNDKIRSPEVTVIDENGQQLGKMQTRAAVQLAKERGFDLVEVAANVRPPVCKFLNYGKLKYEKKKKEKENRKKTVQSDVKEIQLRPNIEDHDLHTKIRKIEEFLADKDKVKIVITFQGREMQFAREHGNGLISTITESLKDKYVVESPAKFEGRRMIMVLGSS